MSAGLALASRGVAGIAAATGLAAVVNAALLYRGLDRAMAPLPHRALARYLVTVCVASAAMGGAVWLSGRGLAHALAGHVGLGARATLALVPVAVGVVVYAGAGLALGIAEVRVMFGRGRTA